MILLPVPRIGMFATLLISKGDRGAYRKDVESDIPVWPEHELPSPLLPRLLYHTNHSWCTIYMAHQADGSADKNASIPSLERLDDRYS